jgi:hypothetical protein
MRPIERFFSQLEKWEQSLQSQDLAPQDRDRIIRDFANLAGPIIGVPAAEDICFRTLDRLSGEKSGDLKKIGAMAAFFLGEYDGFPELETEDWEDIRETLEDVSGDITLDTLTELMGDLLSRGRLP